MISRGIKEEIIKALKRLNPNVDVRDVCVFGGIGAAGYGIGLIYPPGAWIFCGLSLFWLGVR